MPSPSAFTTLSSVAMDELYALEHQEALRRAEYEARHAEALRRAEFRTRQSDLSLHRVRSSKSATTSPVFTPMHIGGSLSMGAEGQGYFGLSNERDLHRGPAPHIDEEEANALRERDKKGKRRLSGPAWQMTPIAHEPSTLPHSHSSGHLVDSIQASRGGHPHGVWGHPYHHPTQHAIVHPHPHHFRHLGTQAHEESPSPISSDSESMPTAQSPPHPFHAYSPQYSGVRPTSSEFAFTPSTSPFLGPLRTLNLHSSNPSRAPSPILLPPSSLGNGDVTVVSPIEDSRPRSRETSSCGSPPTNNHLHRAMAKWKPSEGSFHPPLMFPHYPSHLTERGSHMLPSPQLSSGPSSGGSSPGSLSHPLGPPATIAHHHRTASGNGTGALSTSSSRAPSPPYRSHPSTPQPAPHAPSREGQHHHHLAHSVRLAFMTPILAPAPPRNPAWMALQATSQPHSGMSTPLLLRTSGLSSSVPASRSGSPPITLPPLKMPSALSSPSHRPVRMSDDDDVIEIDGEVKEKVELPGFSQFEAAARGRTLD